MMAHGGMDDRGYIDVSGVHDSGHTGHHGRRSQDRRASGHGRDGAENPRASGASSGPAPPVTSSEYLNLVGHPWTDAEIVARGNSGADLHWLAHAGRVPPSARNRPGAVHRKLAYKEQAEALNTQAHPGHLHEQVFSSPKQKDRGLCVIVLLCIGFIVVACTLALTAQLWILLKVDTQGLAHLQLRHGKMLSETPLQAKSVLLSGPVIPPAVSTTTGAGATTTFAASERESVTLEVSTSLDSSPFSSVQTSAARGVVMSGPSVSVKVGGDAALLNVSARATTVTCSGRLAASTLQGSIAVNDIQNSQPATPLRLTSSSGAVAIAAGRSVLIESKPSGAHVARLSSGGRTTLTSTTAPLELNSGVVQLNLSALTIRPVGFDTFATMKVCVCPRSAVVSKVGSLFMMPPNVSCTDWDDPTAYGTADSGSGSADPCL
eukprot:m.228328 g.228328  ORF g.228328 m.228328 type:complete len:434 (+) comp25974_c0_seq2:405-1706(+)